MAETAKELIERVEETTGWSTLSPAWQANVEALEEALKVSEAELTRLRPPAPPPDATTTTDEPVYDMSIHSNPDAAAWAAFFARTFAPGSPCPDEATMLGWFANAMMAQHDHDLRASRPSSEPTTVLCAGCRRVVGGVISSTMSVVCGECSEFPSSEPVEPTR